MLTDATIAYLSTLTYQADAKRCMSILPLASIYWDDEMPSFSHPLPENDREEVLLMFAIRAKIWDERQLSPYDSSLWNDVRSRAPQWALFRRLELTADEREDRYQIERDCATMLDEFFAGADHVVIKPDERGFETFSATFRLKKENEPTKRRSWWKNAIRKARGWISGDL